ncbi:hypothetical protein GCM10010253_59310 [Streptomyces badius]|uniref:Uncharacterized protein n=1 Tax=Streptomyces badius TaxID=1941 RepID=A0ABQ2TPH5_STRBA|nr:hypothetical protein GCM10010253_59310 [Streptomyces badius]
MIRIFRSALTSPRTCPGVPPARGPPEENERGEANERADSGPAGYRGSCANFAVDQK